MKQQKGTKSFPSLFPMGNETQIGLIESMILEIISVDSSYFLVEVRIKPTQNIKVFLDGDSGITIEKCVQVNRALYKKIEEAGIYPDGDFSLEVSSPGLDEPLKLIRQYKKNLGRKVEVQFLDGSTKEGRLVEVGEDGIIIEESKGKSSHGKQAARQYELINHTFLFNNIKTTKIQVVF
jgi:ribosome maturation factor RimP